MEPVADIFKEVRKSRMNLGEVYFWTDTIKDWKHLLLTDQYKKVILSSWDNLVKRGKVIIYGFVIMPYHLHVIWEMVEKNGKEMPHASFNKFTGHQFLKMLRNEVGELSQEYEVEGDSERKHRFWQRDPLAVLMDTKCKIEQKIGYIHLNPLQERWNLTDRPENYKWSSADFYENGIDEFGFLTHYGERF